MQEISNNRHCTSLTPAQRAVDHARMDRRCFSFYAIAFALHPAAPAQEASPAAESLSETYSSVLRSRCNCCSNRKDIWFIDSHTYAPELPQLVPAGLSWQALVGWST
jgi:hypothetical protein